MPSHVPRCLERPARSLQSTATAIDVSATPPGVGESRQCHSKRNVDIAFNGPRRPHWGTRGIAETAAQVSAVGGTLLGVHGNQYPAYDTTDPRLVEYAAIVDDDYSHWTVPYSNAPWTSLSLNWTSEDPEFVSIGDFDPVDWDLTLQATSPMIDAGVPWIEDPDATASDVSAYGGYRADSW